MIPATIVLRGKGVVTLLLAGLLAKGVVAFMEVVLAVVLVITYAIIVEVKK